MQDKESSLIPWIVVNTEGASHRYSINHIHQGTMIHLLATDSRESSTTFNLSSSSDSQSQFSILTPVRDVI